VSRELGQMAYDASECRIGLHLAAKKEKDDKIAADQERAAQQGHKT
jgi:hypothetical protein